MIMLELINEMSFSSFLWLMLAGLARQILWMNHGLIRMGHAHSTAIIVVATVMIAASAA